MKWNNDKKSSYEQERKRYKRDFQEYLKRREAEKMRNYTYDDGDSTYQLTDKGMQNIERYITELQIKRKEILTAGKDTADETIIPTVWDIFVDAMELGFDEDGDAFNSWGVTDHYDADYPISLRLGEDVERIG